MKELQKYHVRSADFHRKTDLCDKYCSAIYMASEADAHIAALKQQHAEEVERLKADRADFLHGLHGRILGLNASVSVCDEIEELKVKSISIDISELRKQAERYEKLKGIGSCDFERIYWASLDDLKDFDALVDQLPASGEK